MSCRVLGRGVDEAMLILVTAVAQRLGARRLLGEHRPTVKNGMVREHYQKLGFAPLRHDDGGRRVDALDLESFVPTETFIDVREG